MTEDQRGSAIQSVARAALVLKAFTTANQQLSLTQIAEDIGVHKSTASRLASTLIQCGLLEGTGVGGSIRLGPELRRLARLSIAGSELSEIARPAMDKLASETGETVTLSVRRGDYALTVAQSGSTHRIGVQSWVGARTPLATTADGKALLWSDQLLSEILPGPEIQLAHQRGWIATTGELEEHLHGVAVPLLDTEGHCVAALCVSGPSYRLTSDHFNVLGGRLQQHAAQIMRRHQQFWRTSHDQQQ